MVKSHQHNTFADKYDIIQSHQQNTFANKHKVFNSHQQKTFKGPDATHLPSAGPGAAWPGAGPGAAQTVQGPGAACLECWAWCERNTFANNR